jgi:hypothetical protein
VPPYLSVGYEFVDFNLATKTIKGNNMGMRMGVWSNLAVWSEPVALSVASLSPDQKV